MTLYTQKKTIQAFRVGKPCNLNLMPGQYLIVQETGRADHYSFQVMSAADFDAAYSPAGQALPEPASAPPRAHRDFTRVGSWENPNSKVSELLRRIKATTHISPVNPVPKAQLLLAGQATRNPAARFNDLVGKFLLKEIKHGHFVTTELGEKHYEQIKEG